MSRFMQLWLLGVVLVVGGCLGVGTEEAPVVQSAGNMNAVCGSKWELKRLRVNGEVVPVEQTDRFTFLCNPEGNVMGKSGINTFRGALQITDNGQLLWDTASFASTKMAGPEAQMQQENAYLRALAGTRQAFTKGGGSRLILRDASGDIYIEYVKVGP
ncbi:META domain-containing protein [Microbulbifer magnicolonia]|uniref:META domain-containing protein n=1 Tax=Microbulbifer magnicolonia TaxID=3109744 RepID=UPI002B413CD0|nr:META domain-containing protein [Microbulbifer sp. GG15]